MVDYLIKTSVLNFEETVSKIEKLLVEEGFSHMLSKNIDEIIKKNLDINEYSRYTIILGCNPELAKSALDVSKFSGFLFPCSFTVYEENDSVKIGHVSIMKIISEIGLAPKEMMKPIIETTGRVVKMIWDKL